MTVEISLKLNGTFNLIQSGSAYSVVMNEAKEETIRRMVEDTAYQVLPDLKAAYAFDAASWSAARDQFVRDTRVDLLHTLSRSLDLICPDCGE
jgi:hypothetical protein